MQLFILFTMNFIASFIFFFHLYNWLYLRVAEKRTTEQLIVSKIKKTLINSAQNEAEKKSMILVSVVIVLVFQRDHPFLYIVPSFQFVAYIHAPENFRCKNLLDQIPGLKPRKPTT